MNQCPTRGPIRSVGVTSAIDAALRSALAALGPAPALQSTLEAAIFDSVWLDDLRSISHTGAGRLAVARGAFFGYDRHGDDIFRAIVHDHQAPLPVRDVGRHESVRADIDAARSYLLGQFGNIWGGQMHAMFASVDDAAATGRELTLADRNFLDHELLEARLVASGMDQPAAHRQVHESIPPGSNFSPAVLAEFQDRFGPENFRYWNLKKMGTRSRQ